MTFSQFLHRNARWLALGFLLTLSSSFGQTFFISLFGGHLRASFGLTHGEFGWIYTVANISSALVLVWLGKFADRPKLTVLSVLTLLGLAAATVGMFGVNSLPLLLLTIFCLRLFGQGMPGHIAMTAMARWFNAQRGRALAIASLGNAAGEAVFPVIAVSLIAAIGWRETWLAAAGWLLLLSIPLVIWLLRGEPRTPESPKPPRPGTVAPRDLTRGEVLRDPLFYALLPCIGLPGFAVTGTFFHQVHLVEVKGWGLLWFASSFPAHSTAAVLASLLSGWAIVRWNAVMLLPFYLLPMSLGFLIIGVSPSLWSAPAFMALAGLSSGAAATILGALWAELYGTRHLGAIRALVIAVLVFASALAPGFMGALIDWHIGIESQFLAFAVYGFGAAGWLWLVTLRLRRNALAQT